jgi:hypothetical protein
MFNHSGSQLHRFRDASAMNEQFDITLRDCLNALHLARQTNMFSLATFNLNEYEYYASFDNGMPQ